jgi:hypothetical protein
MPRVPATKAGTFHSPVRLKAAILGDSSESREPRKARTPIQIVNRSMTRGTRTLAARATNGRGGRARSGIAITDRAAAGGP